MPELMIFKSVIDSQGVPFTAHIKGDGYYDGFGEWVAGDSVPIETTGIILPISNDLLNFGDGGVYTTKEKRLLCVTPIPEGSNVEYKGNHYIVEAFKDYTDYTDVHIYILRWRKK